MAIEVVHQHNLDTLPSDIFHFYLFNYLDLDDLYEFRLISKKFNTIVKDYDTFIKELSFNDNLNDRSYWFSTTESTKFRNRLEIKKAGLLTNPANRLQFLKRLRFKSSRDEVPSIKFKIFNKFVRLEYLEIEGSCTSSHHTLKLPNLKALSIVLLNKIGADKSFTLRVLTPKLESLSILLKRRTLLDNKVKFTNSKSVKYLRTHKYHKSILMFKNLEVLELKDPINFTVDDLRKFVHLKKLRILDLETIVDNMRIEGLERLYTLKKSDLDMILEGVKVKDVNVFNECYEFGKLEFQMINYGQLEDGLDFVMFLNYNNMIPLLPNKQPADLFRKYTNIKRIKTDWKILDEKQLTTFIQKCPNLTHLTISRSALGQSFYDNLPEICSLTCLDVYEYSCWSLNFKFMVKMRYLRNLHTNQDILIGLNSDLNNLKYLRSVHFHIDNQFKFEKHDVKIYKKGRDEYVFTEPVYMNSLTKQNRFSFRDLVKWFNYLRGKNAV